MHPDPLRTESSKQGSGWPGPATMEPTFVHPRKTTKLRKRKEKLSCVVMERLGAYKLNLRQVFTKFQYTLYILGHLKTSLYR